VTNLVNQRKKEKEKKRKEKKKATHSDQS